ncbi:MAG: glycosyltransferase [Verrucomicrobia bacterium]|nr:glycosyltransferase [Verrucomicrobiota bacterium]
MQYIDCVVIGKNCASALEQTFASIKSASYGRGEIKLTYVDRGSTDGSEEIARQAGVSVIPLKSTSSLFEARQAGFAAGTSPLVQFIDGGSVIAPDWFAIATKRLHSDTAVCFGKRKEREESIWARIVEIDQNSPPGDQTQFGLEALLRRDAFERCDTYTQVLSQQVQAQGKRIVALDVPMLTCDSQMRGWEDWWLYCFEQGEGLAAAEGSFANLMRQECFQRGGGALVLALLGILFSIGSLWWLLLVMAAVYMLIHPRALKVEVFKRDRQLSLHQAALYAWHRSFAVVPEFFGSLRFLLT